MKKVDYQHFGRFAYPRNLRRFDKKLYFIITKADFAENKYNSDLYTLKGKKVIKLTSSGDVSSYYKVGDGIVFPSLRSQKDKDAVKNGKPLTVLQKLSLTGGEATEWLRLDKRANNFRFINDKTFFFTASYSSQYAEYEKQSKGDEKKIAEMAKEDEDYIVLEGLPFWFNGSGFINKMANPLYLYKNGKYKLITDEMTTVQSMVLSADKKKLYYTAKEFQPVMNFDNRLFELDIETLQGKEISYGEDVGHYDMVSFEDGSLMVFASLKEKFGMNENPKVLLRKPSGEYIKIESEGMRCYNNSINCDVKFGPSMKSVPVIREDKYYTIDTVINDSHIISINKNDGKTEQVTKEKGMVSEFVSDGEDGFYALAMRKGGMELYHITADGEEKCLTNLNTACVTKYHYSEPEEISFVNEKGNVVYGFVIKPAVMEQGKKYPAILDIHGGPKTAYGNIYFHEMQLWASMGYAVMYCNPTGSDGRGDEFADIRGKYGTIDYNDIMTFVDKVLEKYDFINKDRLAVTGGSYGGFMTNWIIGHTDRFVAAASQRSISNFISFSNMSDIGASFNKDQTGATIWENVEQVWEHSPLKYADKVKTPTLFIHADQDYRCPLAEGMQMFYALRENGVETRMCIFKGENHELSRSGKPKHRVRRLKEITEWLAKYLNS